MVLPSRKHPRLKNYDYGQGCYHLTLCTKDRRPILSRIHPPADSASRVLVSLYPAGKIVEKYIQNIPIVYSGVNLLKYTIMPNHVHLLVHITDSSAVTVPTIVRSLKKMTQRELGHSIWQDSFYDVVIRNDVMFQCEWNYIDCNPDKWAEDELFCAD